VLEAAGLLDHVDRGSLSQMCQSWAEYVDATAHLKKEGSVIKVGELPRLSPWVSVQEKASIRYNRLAGLFGLTPGSRETLDMSKRDTPLTGKSRGERLLG
jgi:P27 family predicted phage terminase small subunit